MFSRRLWCSYFPTNNPTWTEDKKQDYGGDITWVPYIVGTRYHTQFSMETVPQEAFNLKITVTRVGVADNDVAMIALYAPEGKYLETVLWQLTDDTTQTFTLSRDNSTGKIGQIKMFILDSLSQPTLLTNPTTI